MTTPAMPRLFVTGATGQLGNLVIEALLRRLPAHRVVAGVRTPGSDAARRLRDAGIEVREADYTRPETLSPAFAGIGRLLLISSSAIGERLAQHANVIAAARSAGVSFLAYTSLLRADTSPLGLAAEHRATEALLADSGLPFAVLRNGWYAENHAASVPSALKFGALLGSAGAGRFSSASRADLAEAAAIVLAGGEHAGRVYELGGDESYTLAELAAAIAAAAGRPIPYRDMPKAEFKAVLAGAGLPEPVAELLADSDAGAAAGGLEEHGRQLSALIGRPTTPYREVVARAVASA